MPPFGPIKRKDFLALARWCAQYRASTTARSLRAVRSWGIGPDGLTQATLLTQTRAPSGERLQKMGQVAAKEVRTVFSLIRCPTLSAPFPFSAWTE